MYVPAPPAPPDPHAVRWGAVDIHSSALDPAIPAVGGLAGSTSRTRTNLAVASSTLDVLRWHTVTVAGRLSGRHALGGLAGRMVSLQGFGGAGWRTLAVARTGASGSFRVRFATRRVGSERVRLRFGGEQYLLATSRNLGRLNVYRAVEASWYRGGGGLACGGSLTSATMGVASRTLPCGTPVTLRFDGRTVRVPVVDRGPYVEGRELDLTEATKRALGFGDTGALWSSS
jgi:rare lipoprotein A